MAVELSDPRELNGAAVLGRDDEKLGKVENVYLDNDTRRPEWVAVTTGLFGVHVSLVPLATAQYRDGTLRLPYDKSAVQRAPHHDPERELSADQERELFEHYGVDYDGRTGDGGARTGGDHREQAGATSGRHEGRAVGHDVSGPTTDEAMTRSEEEMRVGIETRERGRARLRKYVVTEEQTTTVPVSHEEVVVEREPITEANAPAAHDGPPISEEEHEVVLHEERPVVGKETVARERVRMGTETRRDEEQVSEQVRKEHIEADAGPDADTEGRSGRSR
ncbi:DUF2382 domain-containing protein [Actinomycetospora sp. TBRC 11914]|uniref:DUF2382 domain-containing protein n=1 Tax=Actinomycetospora sp. TBRC 11914 TaxID=2729387 RepID=UPI00145E7CC4|nr:PRC and DUF2382 domain-containing protein [Actinomycetospora sp. TBRC 11914]NMO90593.1 PRC and DUF2382 domain-containing protein [Actinomycetospora sp. TBRC 11914]